ncbi:MAG: transcriptional regulator NrdR [Christensenellaceae bacterium]|nr:transcriptional regulator NrdR [Christensenellaceae bacterium]
MKCPYCSASNSKVVDSRISPDGLSIRRRRECDKCSRRYTTHEKVEVIPVLVIKSDDSREPFDPGKLRNGMVKACEKRHITLEQIDEIVQTIERKVYNSFSLEINSKQIGEYVMQELRILDEVAYVRFASVHRQFRDIDTMKAEIDRLMHKDKPEQKNTDD